MTNGRFDLLCRPRRERWGWHHILGVLAMLLVFVYCSVALVVFQFRHPELTDTERILRIPEALFWR